MNRAYDFDRNGHLINFDPTQTLLKFPEIKQKKTFSRRKTCAKAETDERTTSP
ncbi:hypothetical protein QM565_09040 [Geitlerinema splendidum]|nr:hypothetical protein [Geitlerinema splendidum]